MRKTLTTGLALALLIPALAFAQPGPQGGGPGNCDMTGPHGRMGDPGQCTMGHGMMGQGKMMQGPGIRQILMHADDINLTDEQKDRLETLADDFQLQRIDKQAELKKARLKLQSLMRDEAADADVMRAIDDLSRLQGEMHKMQYRHHQDVRSVLTEEQIQQLKELRSQRRTEMKEQRGNFDRQRRMQRMHR
jgi:Spy/CpxP family protein refolding chaperone